MLDLSNNYFSGGPFPMKFLSAIPAEVEQCRCNIIVKRERPAPAPRLAPGPSSTGAAGASLGGALL